MLRPSQFADFQADVAIALAKKVGKPPREVAAKIVAALDLDGVCDEVEIAGPGFINLTSPTPGSPRAAGGRGRRARGVVPAPGSARPSSSTTRRRTSRRRCTSATCARRSSATRSRALLEFAGPRRRPAEPHRRLGHAVRHAHRAPARRRRGRRASELPWASSATSTSAARAKFDSDPGVRRARARSASCCCRPATPDTLALWRQLVDLSKRYFATVYAAARRHAARRGRRAARASTTRCSPASRPSSRTAGIARISDGALCVFRRGFTSRDGEPLPLIVRKQDGGYGYGDHRSRGAPLPRARRSARRACSTSSARRRRSTSRWCSPSARQAGWLPAPARAEHVAFGAVLGADKKMFKTRAGDTVRLADLLDEAVERAAASCHRRSPAGPRRGRARRAGAGRSASAPSSTPTSRTTASRTTSSTGTACSRPRATPGRTCSTRTRASARSSARRAEQGVARTADAAIRLREPAERALALELLGFGGAVTEVGEHAASRTASAATSTISRRRSRRSSRTAPC